ncbi:hypothetical protein ACX6XY_10865 [Streptomyces sp. O3]
MTTAQQFKDKYNSIGMKCDLYNAIAREAEQQDRSKAGMLRIIVKDWLARYGKGL